MRAGGGGGHEWGGRHVCDGVHAGAGAARGQPGGGGQLGGQPRGDAGAGLQAPVRPRWHRARILLRAVPAVGPHAGDQLLYSYLYLIGFM